MTDRELRNLHLYWEEIDSFISDSGTIRVYEANHGEKVIQKGVQDFDSDFNPILFIEEV